jgi:hypothetical protein
MVRSNGCNKEQNRTDWVRDATTFVVNSGPNFLIGDNSLGLTVMQVIILVEEGSSDRCRLAG